jgi:hypothetical protein
MNVNSKWLVECHIDNFFWHGIWCDDIDTKKDNFEKCWSWSKYWDVDWVMYSFYKLLDVHWN